MADWAEMSADNIAAAQELLELQRYRSSISRAYYAAYYAVTSRLAEKYIFWQEGNNPSHLDLPNMIRNNLNFLSQQDR